MASLVNGYGTTIEVSGSEAVFLEPAMDDIPTLWWEGRDGAVVPQSKDEGEIKGSFRYKSKTLEFEEYATVKVQGSGSADDSNGKDYLLKNYTVKTYSDEDCVLKVKHAFREWKSLNKFVIKKHWIDCSHIRNVGTAKLWGQTVRSREDFDSLPEEMRTASNNTATDGFTVRFFANGVYQGLYEFIVPKDKVMGHDNDNPLHSMLNSEGNNGTTTFNTTEIDWSMWSEEVQDAIPQTTKDSFGNLITFTTTATDEEFKAGIGNLVDITSVMDFNIFLRLFLMSDCMGRNQLFGTYDGEFWYEGAWDLDCVLGLLPRIPPEDVTYDFLSSTSAYPSDSYWCYQSGFTNNLYDRIETCFKEEFKAEYWRLRKGVLSVSNVISVYDELASVIDNYDGLREEDWAETTANGLGVTIPYTDVNNIQQIRKFVVERFAYMDGIIEAM